MKNDMKNYENWEQKMNDELGFYMHLVNGYGNGFSNFHTHGLLESRNHPDFQIVLPIEPEFAAQILCCFIDRIDRGEEFKPNTYVSNIICDSDVQIIEHSESFREVLRIILPDTTGKFPDNPECKPYYKEQPIIMFPEDFFK